MREGRTARSREQVKGFIMAANILGIIGIASVIIPAILSAVYGYYENGSVFLMVFFASMIALIVILLVVLPDIAWMEAEKMAREQLEIPAGNAMEGMIIEGITVEGIVSDGNTVKAES